MASQAGAATSNTGGDLLALALSRPHLAERRARLVLERRPTAAAASVAHQTIGIVLRDRGEVGPAIRHLRAALRAARSAGLRSREADVLASLGVGLALAGRTDEGERALTVAAEMTSGAELGRILVRRGGILGVTGRHQEALHDLTRAARSLRRAGDALWEARALQSRALSQLARGAVLRADRDLARSELLFLECGQELESAFARHNRGLVAFRWGDLPAALGHLAAAEAQYAALAAPTTELAIDRSSVLLAAGLSWEAFESLSALAESLPRRASDSVLHAELVLAAATAALAAGQPSEAREFAERARRSFTRQRRAVWAARAEHVAIRARYLAGETGASLLNVAVRNALDLATHRAEETPAAQILAGRLAAAAGLSTLAREHFDRASRCRHSRSSALTRSVGWLGRALRSHESNRPQGVLAACAKGLDALDEHILTLGGSELRAHATAHGAELARLALSEAHGRRDGALMLRWSERWRAIALATPPVTPPDDSELARDLAALREVTLRAERVADHGAPPAHLIRERERLEHAVRSRTREVRGEPGTSPPRELDLEALVTELGDALLIELVDVDGSLHAVTVDRGAVALVEVGPMDAATREVEHAVFLLRRIARGRARGGTWEMIDAVGARLQDALLGAAAPAPELRPVIVVPPGRLHSTPWGMLPCFRRRAVSVTPSATTWLRAHRARSAHRGHIALIAGPGLPGGAEEIDIVAGRFSSATVLRGDSANVNRALAAIDGARIAHIAAHGSFRADSPMFSSLSLFDGPLTIHDLLRLRRPPHRLLLTSCDSGVGAPVGADELLGLARAVMSMGTVGVLASVAIVNDSETVPLSLHVHDRLARGDTLAEALADARRTLGGDPAAPAAAVAFVAMGV